MAKETIGVNLKFSADVSAAKKAMQDLQGSLANINSLSMNSKIGTSYASDLNRASQAAAQLRIQLQNAFNQDTGKLNLSKFNQELKISGMSIAKYKQELSLIGPQGEQAFNKLAYSIATAETKTLSLSAGIQRLGATFMNTLRYQLSSSVIMAFTQGISEAVNFTKELNESLNNIRIVTNYGVEEMKEFANYANKSAKALSTSTKAMTDASLIYFQQGLGMKEAQARAETTVKLANVTGESVETVSNQLTAIWNNFYDGSKSLEYYADVITKLGAATASSTDEISQGLEKFAAVAETVGLSYEYATAALATVTSETRQSADVVGTAFKTLFARIQDLELGKTLDDNVTLGKYSQALDAIGVQILDSTGNVKDMNTILNEMGTKWDTISKAQQVSVAQTVAGVRQYTQLIALMENWDKVKGNVTLAETSSGELERQQEIYAESWEAAAERIGAAAETIYQSLLNDEAFVDIMNFFTDFLEVVDKAIDGLGGLPGVLTLIGTALMKNFSPQIASSINNVTATLMSFTKAGKTDLARRKKEANEAMMESTKTKGLRGVENQSYINRAKMQQTYNKNANKMDANTRAGFEAQMYAQEKKYDDYFESEKYQEKSDFVKELNIKRNNLLKDKIGEKMRGAARESVNKIQQSAAASTINTKFNLEGEDAFESLSAISDKVDTTQSAKALEELTSRLKSIGAEAKDVSETLKNVVGDNIANEYKEYADLVDKTTQALARLKQAEEGGNQEDIERATKEYNSALKEVHEKSKKIDETIENTGDAAKKKLGQQGIGGEDLENLIKTAEDLGTTTGEVVSDIGDLNQGTEGLTKGMDKAGNASLNFGQKMEKTAQLAMTAAMAMNNIRGIIDVLNNEDMTWGDKILSILTSIIPTVIMLKNSLEDLNIIQALNTLGQKEETAAQVIDMGVNKAHAATEREVNEAKSGGKKKSSNNAGQEIAEEAGEEVVEEAGEEIVEEGAEKLTKGGKKAGLKLAGAAAIAIIAIEAGKAIYKAADNAYNKDQIAADKAAAAAQSLKEANEEAEASFNKLKEASTTYVDSLNSLSKMTKGTQEYQDAISKANENALEMINTYDELAGQYHTTAEGLIVFNEGALENIQLLERQRKSAAATAEVIGRQNERDAQAKANTTDFLRNKIKSNESSEITTEDTSTIAKGTGAGLVGSGVAIGGAVAATAMGAKLGTAIGSLATPLGAAIGAVVGAAIGAIGGTIVAAIDKKEATKREEKAIDTLAKAYDKVGDAALTPDAMKKILGDEGITDPNLIESLNANSKELKKLMVEIKANTEARRVENVNAAREAMSTMDQAFNSFDTSIQSAMANIEGDIRTRKEKEIDYNAGDFSKAGFIWKTWNTRATKEGKEAFADWKKNSGKKGIEDVDFKKDKITYTYLDENNQRQKAEMSYEELAAQKEGQEISEATKENYEKIRDAVFDIAGQKGGAGFLNAINGQDANELTKDEFEELKAAYQSGEFKDELANLGSIAGTEYANEVKNAIEQTLETWDEDKALTKFMKKTKAEVDNILDAGAESTGASKKALENYTEALLKNQKALNGGKKALTDWQKTANKKIAAEMAVANAKFAKGVVQLNDVMKDSTAILSEWNEGSLETWEAVAKVQEALENAFGVKVSADFVKNNLKEIQELANGDVSSLEQLQQAAARDYVLNLDLADNAKNNLLAMLNQAIDLAQNEVDGIAVDAKLNDSSYIEQLNKMLEAGEITADEVKKTFGAIGYAVDIRTKKVPSTTTQHYEVTRRGGEKETWDVSTTTVTEVPYIAGEGTKQDGETIITSDGSEVTVNHQSNGDGITYTGGNSVKGALVSDVNRDEAKSLKEKQKALKDDVDIYHEEKAILSDIERELKRINKLKDRSWGNARLKAMEKEIEFLKEEQKATEALAEAQRKDAQQRATDLAKNYGAQFNADGQVLNWEELRQQVNDTYLTEWKKAGGNKEIQQELNDWRDKFIKDFENYENILGEAKNNTEKAADQINEIFDRELKEVDYKLEFRIELNENDLKRLQRELKKLDDPIMDGVNALKNLSEQFKENEDNFKGYQEGIKDTLRKSFGDVVDNIDISSAEGLSKIMELVKEKGLDANSIEQLKKYRDGLESTTDSMEELYGEAFERLNSAIQAVGEESDKAAEKINHFNSMLNGLKDVIDIVGAKNLGLSDKDLLGLSDAMVKGAKQSLAQAKTAYKLAQDNYKDIKAQYDNTEDGSEEKEKLKKTLDAAESEMRDAEKNLSSTFQNTLTTIAKDFENGFDIALKAFEKGIAGVYETLEEASKVYEQQAEIAERYLADYEKVYEFSKLNRTINKSINETNNIKGKQELLKLQKEIQKLQESGAEVSQYDLDVLQKRYDLRVAEIALEEAQQNKSIVRMKRDSEGNMAYVYTADSNEIAEKQQNYEDKLYGASDFNEKYISQQESAFIKNKQDWEAALAELKSKQGEMTPEEAEAAMQKIFDYYSEREQYILNELQKATDSNARLYAEDWIRYEGYIDNKKSKDLELRTQFADTAASIIFGYKDIDDAQNKSKAASDALIPELKQLYIDFRNEVKDVFDSVGLDWKNFANKVPEYTKKILKEMGKVNKQFNSWSEDAKTGLQGMIDELNSETFQNLFSDAIKKYYDIADGWINDINTVLGSIEAPNLDDVSDNLIKGLGLEGLSGGLEGLKDYIDELKGKGNAADSYYGTYTIGGKTYRTEKAYKTQKEAVTQAQQEAKKRAQSLVEQHQYNASIGKGSTQYANMLPTELLKNSTYNTQDYESNKLFYENISSTSTPVRSIQDAYGNTVYLSKDTEIKYKNFDNSNPKNPLYEFNIEDRNYKLSEQNVKYILSSLPDLNIQGATKSGGGNDLTIQDPPFEVGDRVWTAKGDKQKAPGGKYWDLISKSFENTTSYGITKNTAWSKVKEKTTLWGEPYYFTGMWTPSGEGQGLGTPVYGATKDEAMKNRNKGQIDDYGTDWSKVWFKESDLQSYDTGGYTGSWDSSGRLAMLHQKEIILNATDTENFLAAINIVRDIAKAIDLQAVAYQSTLGSMIANTNVSMHPQTVQQDVVIHAEFPNATNHSEIEAAFDNLINRASQFANRKN